MRNQSALRRAECVARSARTAPRLIVLQTAVHVVERQRVVDRDRVELSGDDALVVIPGASGVPRHVQAAVAAEDHLLSVVGIDPERVVIGVDAVARRERLKRLAAVARLARIGVERDDVLGIGRIANHLAVVPRGAVLIVDQLATSRRRRRFDTTRSPAACAWTIAYTSFGRRSTNAHADAADVAGGQALARAASTSAPPSTVL